MKSFCHLAILVGLVFGQGLQAQVRISEFMASNTKTLLDEDGASSDWIELQNTTSNTVSLLNWALTDSASNSGKWRLPATNLAPASYMVVYASGKNRAVAGEELHTNFKLSAGGGYLGLYTPDGVVANEVSPAYPSQFPDVSYGLGMRLTATALVATNAAIHYWIPTDASADGTWTGTNFDDSAWAIGTNGIGYETGLLDPQEDLFSAKVLASSPVAYWRLNETNGVQAVNAGSDGVEDVGGYEGNLLLGQAGPRPPAFPTFETNNDAPFFNGTDAYVNGPYELMNDLPAFTMGGWICPTAAQGDRTGLFGQNDTAEFGFISGSTIQFWSPAGSVSASYPFANNTWHYLTVVGGSGQLALYFDGVQQANTTISALNFGESEFDFNIGGGGVFDSTGNFFAGRIDEVAVWFRALATNEITGLLSSNADFVSYTNYLATDVRAQMYGSNATAYVRIPFTVANPNAFDELQLLMRFDDGFAAYLNGHLIAGSNAPAALAWNSAATAGHLDAEAVQWTAFDVSEARQWLLTGDNVLAIQALNIAATNTDFLMQAQLVGQRIVDTSVGWRYFTGPTPGAPNGTSTNDYGPVMSGAAHSPTMPSAGTALSVTADVAPGFFAISNVTLHYRVMFGAESSVAMSQAGSDGAWTGTLPGGVAKAGQLLRYYVTATDISNNISRWPFFPDATDSQEYYGTVVADPSIQTLLPVAYLFIQDTNSADDQTGTQGSLFYLNELYDNLHIYVHGQSSVGWPKKSHNVDFPKDHRFLYQTNGTREDKVIFMSNYSDKARLRTTLFYAIAAQSGGVSLFSFPIRIHLNGSFWGLEDMVEHGDDLWLDRMGRDPDGALYKMYNEMSTASGNEKKTRTYEGTDDLNALITKLDESVPLATRVTFAWDNLDLPQTASYFADLAITSDQDVGHKNYYLYRDSNNTGEWAIFPWDVDLSWGRDWVDSYGNSSYFNDVIFTTNVLNFYPGSPIQAKPSNRLFDLFFANSDFQQMYLRRLRTLMDTILMPAGTPTNQLVIEPLIRQYETRLNPTNLSPSDTTLDNAVWGPSWGDTSLSVFPKDAERLITAHLAGRRAFLFGNPSATLSGMAIPAAQPTNAVIVVGAWDYSPASGNAAEQYVQLQNTNAYPVDVSYWRLTGAVEFTMRPGTVIPAGGALYLAADVNAFRARSVSPHSGQNLFVQGPFGGHLSAAGNSALILENDQGGLVSQNTFAGNRSAAQFVAGNLAVVRAGDGTETLSSHGNSVFIDQFTTNGTLAGSLAIPDGGTNALVVSGSASSEGGLSLSPDGRLLVLAGYHIAYSNSDSSVAGTGASVVPRALGLLDAAGGFALAGVTSDQFNSNNIRSGTTDGLGHYWGAGANNAGSGTFYFGLGGPNTIQNTVSNSIVIQDLGGNLYFSTAKTAPGIWKIVGTPTTPAGASVFLSAGAKASPFAFAFNPGFTTAYLADDTLSGAGGIQRWDLSNGVWARTYSFTSLTNVGARGVAVDFSGAPPVIYATTAEATNNRLVSLADTGAGAAVSTLAMAGIEQVFRGVAWAPKAGTAPQFYGYTRGGAGLALTWTTLLNRNYTLEYSDNLLDTNWVAITNFTASAPLESLTNAIVPAGTNRFFRVLLNP